MTSIDDRAVNMQFNNAQFQQGIGQTTDSINKLNDSLKFNGSTAGLDNVQAGVNKFSFANMESALENISSKFSIFGAIGFTVLQDITNAAINAGKNMADALISPILDGGERRAAAIQQAQFQFRGLGLDINATMAEAKAAVLATAFTLDQAATAAAQLGASGITAGNGLQNVLRGIAGVAAQTGSSFDSVANIFETVAGNGRLMGENLLELASRGVNAAAILAKSFGTSEANVRDMVSKGQVSFQQFSDAMFNAFGPNAAKANELFSGALANMNAALARLGADFEGEKLFALRDIFNSLSPLIDKVHAALMPLINAFNALQAASSAKTVNIITNLLGPGVIAAFQNLVTAILAIVHAIGNGFKRIFPDDTAAQVTSISVFLQNLTAALIPGARAADQLSQVFAGIFAIFDILGQIVLPVVNAIGSLIGFTAEGSGTFLGFLANIANFITKLDQAIHESGFFVGLFRTIAAVLAVPIGLLKAFFGIIADGFNALIHLNSGGFDNFADDVKARMGGLVQIGQFFASVWKGLIDFINGFLAVFNPVIVFIEDVLGVLANKFADAMSKLNFSSALQALNALTLSGIIIAITGFFGNLSGIIRGNGVFFISQFRVLVTGMRVNLRALQMNLNAKTLKEIAEAVALLALSAIALTLVDPQKLTVSLSVITESIAALVGVFFGLSKIETAKSSLQFVAMGFAIQAIAGAIVILAAAVAILGALPIPNLLLGLGAISILLGVLTGSLLLLGKAGPEVVASAVAIAIMAPAIVLLTGAVAALAFIPFLNLLQGLGALVVILAAMTGALFLLNKLGPGLVVSAISIALIAPSLVLLTGVVAALAALPLINLVQGVGAFVVILAVLTGAMLLLGNVGPQVLIAAVSIGAVALSIVPLIGAIALLSTIPLPNLIQGMVALVAAMVILVGAVLLLGFTGPAALIGAAAIVAIGFALFLLAPALKLLSTISWDAIGRLLTVLAAGLGILVVMGLLLIPASVGFLLLGVAILLIGTGIGIAAEGLGKIIVGIGLLTAVGVGGIAVLVLALQAFIRQLPAIGAAFGAAIVAMAIVIGNDAPQLVAAFVKLMNAMLDSIDQVLPHIVEVATTFIVALVNALTVLIPLLVESGITIIEALLNSIANHIEDIVSLSLVIISSFIEGIADGLPRIVQSGIDLIVSFITSLADGIRDNRAKVDKAILNLADAITGGLSTGLLNGVAKVIAAVKTLVSKIPEKIREFLGITSPSKVMISLMSFVGLGIARGLGNQNSLVGSAANDLGNTAVSGLKNALANVSTAFTDNVDTTPTIRPVLDLSSIKDGAKQLPGMIPNPSLSLDTSNNVATSVSLQEQAKNAQLVLNGQNGSTPAVQIDFTQNNTSPKALSTAEVYRNTQNQLSNLKGALGVVDQTRSS